jgi:GMP synthase (glutamine-hydrolysing)
MMKKIDAILVLDFGGQYCHLIGRRIREFNVYSEIVPSDITLKELHEIDPRLNIKGLILSGGPSSVYEQNSPKIDQRILDTAIPVLGLCYGHQLIAYLFGGEVKHGIKQEYGIANITIDKSIDVLKGLNHTERVWMSHGDTVQNLPKDFEVLAHSENCPVAAFRYMKKTIYGLQWHPEVVHTEHGKEMLRNFIFEVCKCKANWRPSSFIDEQIDEIKKTIDGGKAIIALSGGIDSSTAMHACILIPESASHSSTCISPLSFSTSSDSCSILKMGYTFLSLKYIVAGVK